MGKRRGRHTADWILVVAAAATLAAVPFSTFFWGSFLFHTALAAFIGGLADWYAVTSLFRKPLGISVRTELVPKNRDKIIAAARHMVEKEILTGPRIYGAFKKHSPSYAAAEWSKAHQEEIKDLLQEAVHSFLKGIDGAPLVRSGILVAGKTAVAFDWALLAAQLLEVLKKGPHWESLHQNLSQLVSRFLDDSIVPGDFHAFYRKVWKSYEAKGPGRGMLKGILEGQAGITEERAGELLYQRLTGLAADLGFRDSSVWQFMDMEYDKLIDRFKNDRDLRVLFNYQMGKWAETFLEKRGLVDIQQHLLEGDTAAQALSRAAAVWLGEWACREDLQKKTDRILLKELADKLGDINQHLGKSTEQALQAYSGKEMAHLLEESVYYDLQMIRVNGSLVGALLGGIFSILFWIVSGGNGI